MNDPAKIILQNVGAWTFRDRSVKAWPAWLGDLFEIKVPSNVKVKHPPSFWGGANINILLELLDRVSRIEGDCAECGVFRGATLLTTGLYLKQLGLDKRVYGFDSFEGFDGAIEVDLSMRGAGSPDKRVGGFGQTSEQHVKRRAGILGLGATVVLRKGYFKDILPMEQERRYCFVHLDCDIYESYRECLEYLYPQLSRGGIVLLDEYNDPPWPGCNKAVEEFLRNRPEKLQLIERDGYQKYYFTKR